LRGLHQPVNPALRIVVVPFSRHLTGQLKLTNVYGFHRHFQDQDKLLLTVMHRRIGTLLSARPGTSWRILLTPTLFSLTEILFEDAVTRARELDTFFAANGRPIGPLHGVPMTLKDQFDVAGYDSTLGYVGRAFQPALQDCVLVSTLKQVGAIIIAKSNLPQSIMVCQGLS